jgi:hypothetical protein
MSTDQLVLDTIVPAADPVDVAVVVCDSVPPVQATLSQVACYADELKTLRDYHRRGALAWDGVWVTLLSTEVVAQCITTVSYNGAAIAGISKAIVGHAAATAGAALPAYLRGHWHRLQAAGYERHVASATALAIGACTEATAVAVEALLVARLAAPTTPPGRKAAA